MKKQDNKLTDKELLKKVERLIDGDDHQKNASSFFGFCSKLLSIKPKVNNDFQNSLKKELLKNHPCYVNKKVEDFSMQKTSLFYDFFNNLTQFTMKNFKKIAFAGIPALALGLFFVFSVVLTPQNQIANAMDIVANDSQVREVIEQYNLDVQEVITKGNTAYIVLNTVDDATHIMGVDLESGKVEEIVKEKGEKDMKKAKAFEQKAAAMGMSAEEFKSYLQEQYEAKAESMGMSIEEFKKYLANEKKSEAKAFEQKAAAMGMSAEEFKSYLQEQYEAKAESMGMSIEEFKKYLANEKKDYYKNFKAKAETKGMTEKEYKEYLGNQKK